MTIMTKDKLADFLYMGGQLTNSEGKIFDYVNNHNSHVLINTKTGEKEYFTPAEFQQLFEKELNPVQYSCEFTRGESEPWQPVSHKGYVCAWDCIVEAMEWLQWDDMAESEKANIYVRLWNSTNNIVGIYNAHELEQISYGEDNILPF